jgi:murein L,D-transpeptidase YcbB/YkuD
MLPNEDNIYLHDTPAGHLFSRARRDFSHGCIRLERPRDMAELVMRTATQRSPSELDALLETNDEKWIKLDEQLPVYILYFTAWVQEDGTVRFHHDVYGRDEQLEEQAEEKLT